MDGGSTEDAGDGSFAGLGSLEGWRAHWQIAIWCIVLCGSVLLNVILLVAFVRKPGLRTISNRFVMNLIASNLLVIFVLAGLRIANSCYGSSLGYTKSLTFHALSEGVTAMVTTSSILSVLLIGVDQYLAVVDPLRYRTRIDKLKCGLLIFAVWLIALSFGTLASFNPNPRGLWQACFDDEALPQATRELRFQASLVLNGTATEVEGEISFEDNVDANLTSYQNATEPELSAGGTTYGLVYALVYSILGYLVPIAGICWIYLSIYTAARNNSERTRRNGSRPILSSGSFSEEGSAGPHRPDTSVEDFRRIPKISSLSSIDENSEASPSRITSPADDEPHEPPEPPSHPSNELNAAVVFTLGSTRVDVDRWREIAGHHPGDDAKDSTKSKVPTAALKAKFLMSEDTHGGRVTPELVKSRFPEVSDQRRKSSHDIAYEEATIGKHPYEYDDDDLEDSSDEDEEDDEEVDGDPTQEGRELEEVVPLSGIESQAVVTQERESSVRSVGVNFDLVERTTFTEESRLHETKSAETQANGSTCQSPPVVTVTPPGRKNCAPAVPLHRVPSVKSSHGYINNLKYRISNGSLFKYKEETRAARISALVIVMGLICWTPYIYVLLVRNLSESCQDKQSRAVLDTTALSFLIVGTYISPLLFGYRSRRVKRELRKLFCFKRELSYKNNRSLMAKKVLRRRHSGATILGQFGPESMMDGSRYNIFNCVYGRNRWPKEKVQFVQVPETALAVETCRSSFSSGASTQISSTSTDEY